jgi:hypothetical protein
VLITGSCGEKTANQTEAAPQHEITSFEHLVDARNISPDSLDQILVKTRQPVILYFSGYACVNSRKIEDEILQYAQKNPAVQEQNLVVFMVDEKTPLPSEEKYFSPNLYDSITTMGERNMEIQQMFGRRDQPCFLKIDNGYHIRDSLSYMNREHMGHFFGKSEVLSK